MWEVGEISESWRVSRLVCLWKNKGKLSDPSKYRGLSVNALLNKLVMAIGHSDLSEFKHGIMLCWPKFVNLVPIWWD